MPPKKKIKEPEPIQQVQPQSPILKIPKKPFYRSVHFDSSKRAKQIQIKLWKIDSLKAKLWDSSTYQDLSCVLASQKRSSEAINHLIKKQRIFKNLRRLDYDFYQYQEVWTKRLIPRCWRLEKLLLNCFESSFPEQFFKKLLSPHLKDLFWKMKFDGTEVRKSINGWEYLVDCDFWFKDSHVLNTKNMREFVKSLQRSSPIQVIPNIRGISQNIPLKQDIFDLTSKNQSHFPNLKTLHVHYSVSDYMPPPHPTLDFIRNYPKLTSLFISTHGKDVPSFEFLSSLPNLTQWTLISCEDRSIKIPKTLPLIHSFEKLKIACYPGEFPPENVQEFLLNNENLKHLEVQFSLQDDHIIFNENLILPIQTLKLVTHKKHYVPPMTTATKRLASFLSKYKSLPSLDLRLGSSFSFNEYESLTKALTSMTCLEHLTWFCEVPNELQDNKLKDLKKTLIQNPGIQKLELDFGGGILTAKDFSNLLDGLLRLEKLRYLFLTGNFHKITPAAISKFTQFLRSLIHENAATVCVRFPGMSLEVTKEIDRVIAQKSDLW